MENNYKLVTYRELAEFIINMECDVIYTVTDSIEYYFNDAKPGKCALWFGFLKTHAFDTDFVTFGYMGGGEIQSFEVNNNFPVDIDELEYSIRNYAICHMEIATKYSKLLLDLDITSSN